jgi:hypothetical protein
MSAASPRRSKRLVGGSRSTLLVDVDPPPGGRPGPEATRLVGAREWDRDTAAPEDPQPPPFTTIAWRLVHLVDMLTVWADHTIGRHRRS